ncbi:Ubiquitin-activating enzyme E1-like protein [Emericellopsis cladophorae]|uniref:Ubiquitin-activating enzyme E1-like n=1 Tax=Emericellopsis cladophorae TaxID=2686198 RepID=A0A9P9Y6F9_9HYPO|nr:Ubiquitin-activating enzyme E1-like protein [Emericellopsis cladophorae]KAI6784291.1 Ubiquitin-activating enzyme E1-like protein [Emericellopsis cladophorae]
MEAVTTTTAPAPAAGGNRASTDAQKKPLQNRTDASQTAQGAPKPKSEQQPPPQRRQVAPRDRFNQQSLGPYLNSNVKQARVLMVGAGGIGCELLKNLVLSGFGEIHVVDLDTIDLSNLNRQFLFRHEHIKKSKALVAKDAARKFNPKVNIVAHHANIKDTQFNVSWFRDFRVVFNALDNLEARRHVNKIPKEVPKSFPICTIRSTPSQPIHCIVWAKNYLLNEIFGTSEEEGAFDHSEDADNAKEIEELKRESEALKNIRAAVGTSDFPQMLFDKVFNADIERLRSVEDMWKTRRAPEPLAYDALLAQSSDAVSKKDLILADDQRTWSVEENLAVFNDSLDRLSRRLLAMKKAKTPDGPDPVITFDKDDPDTLDFVTATSNIRSTIFGIDKESRFDVKKMAGNIIPAIATTNAIVAGLCVLQSFKVLKGEYRQAKEVFLTPFAYGRLLAPDRSREPNPACPVCGVFNATIVVDPSRTTLEDVVEGFLRKHLGFGEKEFVLNNDVGVLYDPDEVDNLPKKLQELKINDGSFLTVIDEDDEDTLVNVVINVEEGKFSDDEPAFRSPTSERPEIPKKPQKPSASEPNGHTTGGADPEASVDMTVGSGLKRSHPDGDESEQQPKKAKRTGAMDNEVVTIEDAGGTIVIED